VRLLAHSHRVALRRPESLAAIRPLLIEAAVLLRVGKEPGVSTDPEFAQWVEKQKFRSQAGNDVQFKSLPVEEQAKIRARWQQAKQEQGQQQEPKSQKWDGLAREESKAFGKWLGQQGADSESLWSSPGNRPAKKEIWRNFQKDRNRTPTVSEQMAEQRKREENKTPEEREKEKAQGEKKEQEGAAKRKKLQEMSPNDRPQKWVSVDNGNSMWHRGEIGDDAKVKDSKIVGTIDGSATVETSRVGARARVGGEAQVRGSDIDSGVVEDNARVTGCEVGGGARVRGDSDISDAKIRGGTWDGVQLKGRGGIYHDSYDPKTLETLSGVRGNPSPGDGPLRAMERYFADGGRTKGWLGGDYDRKKLQRKIQEHTYDRYDRKDPWLGRGASFIDQLDDEGFDHLMGVAQRRADESQTKKRRKKAMLYQLTKTALEHPEFREGLLPLVKLGKDVRTASGGANLRQAVIRTAFEATDPEFKTLLVRCVMAADRAPEPSKKVAQTTALSAAERKRLVRVAYESKDSAARKEILEQIKTADARHDELIEANLVENDSWEGPLAIEASEYKTLVRVAYSTKDLGRRREILGLLKEAKYSPGFMKYVEKQQWKHPETGNMVQFVSLPPKEQKKIHEQWKAGKKDWAQKFKPDGLGEETELSPEKFDDLKPGDRLWISWAPHVEHKVTGFNKTKTGKPVLEMVMVNPETGEEGEERYMHRSSAGNPKHDIHILPEGAKPKDPAKTEDAKAEAPKEEPKAETPKSAIPAAAKESLEIMHANAGSWMNAPGMPGYGASFSAEDAPFSEGDIIEIEEGGYPPIKYKVQAGKLVVGPNGSAMMATPLPGQKVEGTTLIPIGGKYEPQKMKGFDESGKPKPAKIPSSAKPMKSAEIGPGDTVYLNGKPYEVLTSKPNPNAHGDIFELKNGPDSASILALDGPKDSKGSAFVTQGKKPEKVKEPEKAKEPEKTEAPKAMKHKDRKELRGVPKPDSDKVKLTAKVKQGFTPDGLSDEAKKATEAGFKGLTYGGLKQLATNVQAAVDDPEGAYAKALAGSGYSPGDLSEMHKTIKTLMRGAEGRKYTQPVLDIANKYDLESEDADELYDFKDDKPGRGKKLTDQQLFDKFLAKAKPETRERMQGMNLKDFMIMYASIMDEEDEEV